MNHEIPATCIQCGKKVGMSYSNESPTEMNCPHPHECEFIPDDWEFEEDIYRE